MNYMEVRNEIKARPISFHSQDSNLDFAPVVCRGGQLNHLPRPVPCLGGSCISPVNGQRL